MDFVYVGSLQVLRSLKVMVISCDADNGFLALITFSAKFTDTDTDNLHTQEIMTFAPKIVHGHCHRWF